MLKGKEGKGTGAVPVLMIRHSDKQILVLKSLSLAGYGPLGKLLNLPVS
jgi:hypothetical protein